MERGDVERHSRSESARKVQRRSEPECSTNLFANDGDSDEARLSDPFPLTLGPMGTALKVVFRLGRPPQDQGQIVAAATLPPNEADRRRSLAQMDVLDSAPEAEFDALVKVAALVCGTSISLISLIDSHRQWFKANMGLPGVSDTPREPLRW